VWGGVSPSPEKKSDFGASSGAFWCILGVIFTVHENYFNCINLLEVQL